MLKRQFLIIPMSILMAIMTYQLPFIYGKKIAIENISESHQNGSENQKNLDYYLKKEYLTEEEFYKFTEKSEKYSEGISVWIDDNPIDLYSYETYHKIRASSIIWVLFAWIIYLIFIPKSKIEYMESIILPLLFAFYGIILNIEIATIIALAAITYVLKIKIYNKYTNLKKKNNPTQ